MKRIVTPFAGAAVLLLASCEPALTPVPLPAPADAAPKRASFMERDAQIDQALRMMNPGKPVDPRQRETVRRLAAELASMPAPPAGPAEPPAVSPAMHRALREISTSRGDSATAVGVLRRLAAERPR